MHDLLQPKFEGIQFRLFQCVVDLILSFWRFSPCYSFSSFVPLTPLLAISSVFTPSYCTFPLFCPPPVLRNVFRIPDTVWYPVLSNISPLWATASLVNRSLPNSSAVPNVQKMMLTWPNHCIHRGRRERRAKKGLRARKENRVPLD